MGKNKLALAICFCLIAALAGFSAWLYVGAKGLEGKVGDLESKIGNLETQNAELNEKVQNLTDWRDTIMKTVTETEELKILSIKWSGDSAIFTVKNTGSAELTIVEVRVNGVSATMNPSSIALIPGAQETITVTKTDVFASGVKYEFAFITTSGMQFKYAATAQQAE